MVSFRRYELRTSDVPGARAFYADVLGSRDLDVVPLPEQAAARGAPAHWLGHLGVEDVEVAAEAFVARGASRLGQTRTLAAGGLVAGLRGPGGEVVGLASTAEPVAPADVVWHQLFAIDAARALESYRALFGWALTDRHDLGPLGVFQDFAWRVGGASVGSVADLAGRPGVHPQWLFHFRVAALEPALDRVRRARGVVVSGPHTLPGGDRLAVCDDPQGAAFALRERA